MVCELEASTQPAVPLHEMIKPTKKHLVAIAIAVILGLFFASGLTDLQGPCTTADAGEDIAKCVEFSDAVMQPGRMIENEQNSLVRFSSTFVVVSLTSLALLGAVGLLRRSYS